MEPEEIKDAVYELFDREARDLDRADYRAALDAIIDEAQTRLDALDN
jgi:hypothetical protein